VQLLDYLSPHQPQIAIASHLQISVHSPNFIEIFAGDQDVVTF